jgi:hypothetical protein
LIFQKIFVIIFLEKKKTLLFNFVVAARFGTKRAEFSSIPHPADFVKQKMKKNCTRSDPEIW